MINSTPCRHVHRCLLFIVLIIVIFCFPDVEKHDKEGRVITAEYEKFYVVTACKCFKVNLLQKSLRNFFLFKKAYLIVITSQQSMRDSSILLSI